MKTKIAKASKSTWSLLLVLVMLMSSFTASAVTLKKDVDSSGAFRDIAESKGDESYIKGKTKSVNLEIDGSEKTMSSVGSGIYKRSSVSATSSTKFRVKVTVNGDTVYTYSRGGSVPTGSYQDLYKYDNTEKWTIGGTTSTAADYTIYFDTNTGKVLIEPSELSLGTSADLTVTHTSVAASDVGNVNATVTITGGTLDSDKDYIVTLTITGNNASATKTAKITQPATSVTFSGVLAGKTSGEYTLQAVVSTEVQKDGVGYGKLTTSTKTVNVTHNAHLYYVLQKTKNRPTIGSPAPVLKDLGSGSSAAVTDNTYAADEEKWKYYSVIIYDVNSNFQTYNCVTDFEIVTANNRNIAEATTETDADGYTYYRFRTSQAGYKPVVHIDYKTAAPKIWVVAEKDSTTNDTLDSNKTVTYYFAEPADNNGYSLAGDGVKIKYWNSSYYYTKDTNASFIANEYIYLYNYEKAGTDDNSRLWYARFYIDGASTEKIVAAEYRGHDGDKDGYKVCRFTVPNDGNRYNRVIFRAHESDWNGKQSVDLDASEFVQGKNRFVADTITGEGKVSGHWAYQGTYNGYNSANNLTHNNSDNTAVASGIHYTYDVSASDNKPKYGIAEVTTPVGYKGQTVTSGDNNTIYVQHNEMYNRFKSDNTNNFTDTYKFDTGIGTYKVYKVDLPIWATSFVFLDTYSVELQTDNAISITPNKYTNDASYFEKNGYKNNSATIALNPNRIYLLFQKEDQINWDHNGNDYNNKMKAKYRCRGIILDEHLWKNATVSNKNTSSSATNQVTQQGFTVNAVNFNTQYSNGGVENSTSSWFNKTALSPLYKSYPSDSALYLGYFDMNTTYSYNKFKMWNNLAFRTSAQDNESYYFASSQGLVGDKLSGIDDEKRGRTFGKLQANDNSTAMPLFTYTNSNSILSYGSTKTNRKFDFNKSKYNGITTYSFDSTTDYNREWDSTAKKFAKTETYRVADVGENKGLGLFPYFDSTHTSDSRHCERYGYAMEFQIPFYMTSTGALTDADGNHEDIVFNFSGDDDVWVFIDGFLALDLGGDHKVSSASINFTDMKVYYKTAGIPYDESGVSISSTSAVSSDHIQVVDLAGLLAGHTLDDGSSYSFNNKDETVPHTFQMFYMERGSFDSNCSISFNLPQSAGLTVSNDIDFSNVNSGLLTDTQKVANQDYFTYSVQGRLAKDDPDYNTVNTYFKNAFGGSNNLLKYSVGESEYNDSEPLYPIAKSDNKVIRTQLNNTLQNLLTGIVNNAATGTCSSYWLNYSNSAFTPLNAQNYKLIDNYALPFDSSDVEVEEGAVPASGQTNASGTFGLLYGQAANFKYKIPAHTLLQVKQNDALDTVAKNAGMHNISTITGTRTVKDYYSTTYKIVDNMSKDASDNNHIIGQSSTSVHTGDVYADDASGLSNMFYFSNYGFTDDAVQSVSMNVDYQNEVHTEDIIIRKTLTDNDSTNDLFYFTVKFNKIFGKELTDGETLREYPNITYNTYKVGDDYTDTVNVSPTNKVPLMYSGVEDDEKTTYGLTGGAVKFQMDNYAVIKGVPAGTEFKIEEKLPNGYAISSVTAAVANSSTTATVGKSGDDFTGVVTGSVPLCSTKTTKSDASAIDVTYQNKSSFTVNFKYYKREVKSGTAAHISETATITPITVSRKILAANKADSADSSYTYDKIVDSAFSKLVKPESVINEYQCWNKLSNAVTGLQSQTNHHTKAKYSGETTALQKHTDCYGNVQGTEGCKTSDNELWVSYKDKDGTAITEDKAYLKTGEGAKNDKVNTIDVWLYNNLKEYTVTFYYAKNDSDIVSGKNYSENYSTSSSGYYNVRNGKADVAGVIDDSTAYLQNYGITQGYNGKDIGEEVPARLNGGTGKFFQYWAYDKEGKYIASTQRKYMYRFSRDLTLYAIYGSSLYNDKDTSKVGLTVIPGKEDYYFNDNGDLYATLNTVMCPYNYETGHEATSYDPKITETMVIYIQDRTSNNAFATALANDEAGVKSKVNTLLKNTLTSASTGSVTVTVSGENTTHTAARLKFTIVAQSVAESDNDSSTTYLTAKNRMQFSNSFKTSSLILYQNLYTFGAMNYNGTWHLSDNCVRYEFLNTGKLNTNENRPVFVL